MSRSSWARGLKPAPTVKHLPICWSRSSWARGLKLNISKSEIYICRVALLVGAWIETSNNGSGGYSGWGRAPRGRVD